MKQLHFRAVGFTEDDQRRWRKPTQRFFVTNALLWLLALVLIYTVLVEKRLESAPISGVVPGMFTIDGGRFKLSVSPLDTNGNLIIKGLTNKNFLVEPIKIASFADPKNILAEGKVIVTSLTIDQKARLNGVLLFDSSGSMSDNDRNNLRKSAGKQFVSRLGRNDKIAIMTFGDDKISVLQSFTSEKELLNIAIEKVGANGGTPMFAALLEAIKLLSTNGGGSPAIFVLTDGKNETKLSGSFKDVVKQAYDLRIPIFPIGLGGGTEVSQLQGLALQTGGTFASAQNAEQLSALFDKFAISITEGRIIVNAKGVFEPPLSNVGSYYVSGGLKTRSGGNSITTPFRFPVELQKKAITN